MIVIQQINDETFEKEVEARIHDVALDQILLRIGWFLKGCGFAFDGEVGVIIDLVDDEA